MMQLDEVIESQKCHLVWVDCMVCSEAMEKYYNKIQEKNESQSYCDQ